MKKIASLIFILIMTMQLGAFADEGKVFMRKGTGTTWSDWTQFYTTANKPTASDIGATTKSYVDNAINTALGDVATILQEINGE